MRPDTETKPLRLAVLLNPAAGSVLGRSDAIATIRNAFAQHGISAEPELLSGAQLRGGARRALRLAKSHQIDGVVVGGGDGSIAAAAGVLANSGLPLGILPLGTLNHFAKDLGLPLGLDAAIAAIATGQIRKVDLAEVNGETFINNSSIGIYPYLVLDRERLRRRRRMSKWTAMMFAVWRTLRHFPMRRLRIRAGGRVEPSRSPCVFVGNNRYLLTGRVAGKRERLDAGELCVYVARRQSRLALFWLACRSLAGFIDQSRDLHAVQATEVEISSHTSRLLVALDGEVTMLRPPLRYRVRPQALTVFAPLP